jgi:hypothetical protein
VLSGGEQGRPAGKPSRPYRPYRQFLAAYETEFQPVGLRERELPLTLLLSRGHSERMPGIFSAPQRFAQPARFPKR